MKVGVHSRYWRMNCQSFWGDYVVVLPFTVLEDKLLNGTKRQTTRYNAEYWLKRYHAWLDMPKEYQWDLEIAKARKWKNFLQPWWLGPRGRNPAAYPMGIGRWYTYDMVLGSDLNDEFAVRDGFGDRPDPLYRYKMELGRLHKMGQEEVNEHEWGVIDWRWVVGPSKPKKVA